MDTASPEPDLASQLDDDEAAKPEGSDTGERTAWIVLYSACIVITLFLNSILIIGLKNGLAQTKKNYLDVYLLSLIVSRMFIAAFVVPARITGLFSEEYLGSPLCKLCHYIGMSSAATSIFSTSAIAILKYQDIVVHKGKRTILNSSPGLGVCIIWIVGYIYGIRTPILYDLEFVEGEDTFTGAGMNLCVISSRYNMMGRNFLYIDLIILFLLPGIIIAFCYIKAVSKLAISQAKGKDNDMYVMKGDTNFKDIQIKHNEIQDPAKEKTMIAMMTWVAVLFFLCSSLPYGLRLFLIWSGADILQYRTLETAFYMVSYSNAWLNAVVLLYYRKDLRNTFAVFQRRTHKVHSDGQTQHKEDER